MSSEFDKLTSLLKLPSDSTIVDVGANKGQFMEFAIPAYRPETYVAIEPISELADKLRDHPLSAEVSIFHVVSKVIGKDSRTEVMYVNAYTPISSLLPTVLGSRIDLRSKGPWRALVIKEEPLDHVLESLRIGPVDLLKIDVQGYEDRVLEGALSTLTRTDNVVIEMIYDDCYEDQADPTGVSDFLTDSGFRVIGSIQEHRDNGRLVEADVLFSRRSGTDG